MAKFKKEYILIVLIVFITIFIIVINQFIINLYKMNLFEYLKYSQGITESERNYLNQKRTLYYVSDENAPPFSFQDKNTGLYKGFIIDYSTALSIDLNIDIEFVPMVWEEAVKSIVSNEADMIELYKSKEREKYLSFTETIYTLRAIAVTLNNQENIKNISDLSGKRIAIQGGDYANEFIKNNFNNVEIVNTIDYLHAIKLLLNNDVDIIVGDEPVLIYFIGDLGVEDQINIINEPLYEMDMRFGVNKSNSELLSILNKGLLRLKKTDFALKIQQKWFGISAPIQKDKLSAQIMFLLMNILILLFVLVIGFSTWGYFLKKQVQKRTEELSKSKDDLQATFDAISDFLIVIDRSGIISNINNCFANWLKKDKDSIIGLKYNIVSLLDSIDFESDDNSGEIEYEGKHYIYYITIMKSNKNKLLFSIEDITNETISRQQMLQQNKMIAVGQLAAGFAHEIRNPLGVIRNYCYVLKNKIKYSDELIEKSLLAIESSVLRAGKMVENLLNFSRIKSNEFQYINIRKSINDLVTLEMKSITDKEIILTVNCDDNLMFLTSSESFSHIIINLLLNAIDAVPYGGSITISCYRDSEYLYIDFADTGFGIEESYIEQIFNPFFTTKKDGTGTGLGLYIVYNELQRMDGEVITVSKTGEGTTFKLKFKIKDDENGRI